MQPNSSGPGPAPPSSGTPRSFTATIVIAAVAVVLVFAAIAVAWVLAPRAPPSGGNPPGSTGTYYGFPVALSNFRCLQNCDVAIVHINSSAVGVLINVTSLTVPFVAFQLTVTNLGTNWSAASHFGIYGGEVASVIFYPTYLNTTEIDTTVIPPLAPYPQSGNNVTVTLSLTPKDATDFMPTANEFFWLGWSITGTTPWFALTSIHF